MGRKTARKALVYLQDRGMKTKRLGGIMRKYRKAYGEEVGEETEQPK